MLRLRKLSGPRFAVALGIAGLALLTPPAEVAWLELAVIAFLWRSMTGSVYASDIFYWFVGMGMGLKYAALAPADQDEADGELPVSRETSAA